MFCGIKYALFLKGGKLFINESAFKNPREVKNPQWSEGRNCVFPCSEQTGGEGEAPALRGTSLCCVNGCWAFIWQYLTHGRRCTWLSHNSKPDRLNGTYCTGSRGTAERNALSFSFCIEAQVRMVSSSPCIFPVLSSLFPFSLPLLTMIYTERRIWNPILTVLPDGAEIV